MCGVCAALQALGDRGNSCTHNVIITPSARQTHMQNSTIIVGERAAPSLLTPQCSDLVSSLLYDILYAGP